MLPVLGLLIKSVNIRFAARSLVARTVQGARHVDFNAVAEELEPLKILSSLECDGCETIRSQQDCSALFWVSVVVVVKLSNADGLDVNISKSTMITIPLSYNLP